MSLKVVNLSKNYGEQIAVNNISFEVAKGEIVGFLGPNGAGKSTTMKIAAGFIPATSGQVFINDIDVALNTLKAQTKLGYLPESNALYYDMYVREFLEFCAGLHQMPNPKARIQEMIELTGLQVEEKKQIGQLSKGYKQRVGLAQAMLHNPDVLILDEPTSGLDPNQIVDIRDLIKQVGKNKTILLSTHIMQEVQALCDRVVIINKGNIVVNATLLDLQKQYKDLSLEEIFSTLTRI
jgi:ABC-2 type transport system ATP-binding protein